MPVVDLCGARPEAGYHETCHEKHDQLVVPDPIEAKDEHALFALDAAFVEPFVEAKESAS
jgi:hypothetical protein